MTLGFAVVLVALCGCQPDESAGPWTTDGGIDSEDAPLTDLPGNEDVDDGGSDAPTALWDGEWTSLPPTRGGQVLAKLDGQLVVADERYGGEILAVSSDGETWREPATSPIASRVSPGRQLFYAEASGQRFLLAPGDDGQTQLWRAGLGTDDWEAFGGFPGVDGARYIGSVDGRLVVTGRRGIYLERDDGTMKDIKPESASSVLPDVRVVDSSIFTFDLAHYVSTDLGESWSASKGLDDVQQGARQFTSLNGKLYTLGEETTGLGPETESPAQYFLSSSEGEQWQSVRLTHDEQLDEHSMAALDGDLYATEQSGRLVRLTTNGSVEPVTNTPSELGGTGDLYAVGTKLVTSIGPGAVATWEPGDSQWTVAPVAEASEFFQAKDGRVWAQSSVVQSIGEDGWRWERDWSHGSIEVWTPSGGWVGHKSISDCLYTHDGSGWKASLQWTDNGIRSDCSGETTAGKMTDIVAFRDGYAVSRNSDLVVTGGPPGGGDVLGNGGLIYWNPDTGATEHLVPEGLETNVDPGVLGIANVDGTLWVQTASGRGIPGNQGTLYRVDEDGWTKVEPDVVGRDGTRYEEWTAVNSKRLRGYDPGLIAEVQYSDSEMADRTVAFAQWNPDTRAFEVLPAPAASVQKRSFTDLGPVVVTSKTLRRYDIQQGEWQQIGRALPTSGENIAQVTAEPGAFYLNSRRGDVWVTRATTGNE